MPPEGIIKTRVAFEQLLSRGIGDTLRVSLTLPNPRKHEEITVGQQILDDIAAGRFRSVPVFDDDTLNIVSCPSCSRVENEKFVELAQQVKEMTAYAQAHALTIAVMGCRVNGPGETDDADLGLWCGPTHVNLKRQARAPRGLRLRRDPAPVEGGAGRPHRGRAERSPRHAGNVVLSGRPGPEGRPVPCTGTQAGTAVPSTCRQPADPRDQPEE